MEHDSKTNATKLTKEKVKWTKKLCIGVNFVYLKLVLTNL